MLRRIRQLIGSPKEDQPQHSDQPEFLHVPPPGGFQLCEANCPGVEGALVPVCHCGTALAPIVTNGGPRLVVRALACPQGCGGSAVMCGAVLLPGDELSFQNGEEEAAIQ
jgi:hypothetical protein